MMFWFLWAALGCSSSPEEVSCEVLDEAQCSSLCIPDGWDCNIGEDACGW